VEEKIRLWLSLARLGELLSLKRLTGEHVMATKKSNMYKEAAMKFVFYSLTLKHDAGDELPWGIGA
jgi:hypothetical protein